MALASSFSSPYVFYALAAVGLLALRWYTYRTDTPNIKGLPEIPGWPLFGSLVQLGDTHAKIFGDWAKGYGAVFQVRLGARRVVVANTFESVKQLWINNQSALVSRPIYHTFHSVVSSSQGFTIGTSPWDESLKLRRKVAATALNRPAVEQYMPIVDLETNLIVKEMLRDSQAAPSNNINPIGYIQRFALNTSLTLNYGLRIGGTIDDELLREVVTVEREIGNLRSTSHNWQDYVPLLRLLPNKDGPAKEMRTRRDKYMSYLLAELRKRIASGTDKPCITGNILKDPEAKLNEAEVKSLCITMVAGGLDTLPGNIIMTIGYWSSPHGQEIQQRAYEEIMKVYPNGDGYQKCLEGERIPYMVAMVKEALRFWSAFQISLPRTSVKPVKYEGTTIPAGTMFYMASDTSFPQAETPIANLLQNSWAANYDDSHFVNPGIFNPERYLKDTQAVQGTPHYAFGAGSRMCIGSHLANREIYTIFTRLILSFRFLPTPEAAEAPILDALECGAIKTAMALQPKPFKVRVVPRDDTPVSQWVAESDERTKDCL